MGDLATDLAVYYQIGIARGDYSLLSSMDVKDAEFFPAFGNAVNDLILRHCVDLNRKRWQHAAGRDAVMEPRTKSHLALNPKARWVDATPEYSFHICGLRKLSRCAIHRYPPGCNFHSPIDAALPSCERTKLGR
jgi:hypothetical protein